MKVTLQNLTKKFPNRNKKAADMTRRGVLCSIIRDLTTAVENKESARTESNKAYGLWAFSLWGGFVFDQNEVENRLL